jgi:beta-glucosidase
VVGVVAAPSAAGAGAAGTAGAAARPWMDRSLKPAARAERLLAAMTLEEKVGQMTQAERGAVTDDPTLVATWRLGSVLSGGGSTPADNTPEGWADMVDGFQAQALDTRLGIPLVYGVDSVHGHGNLVGATVFPHNIGLGATRDPGLVERVEHVTAAETRATGPQWVFAPCVCVARDLRWGRTYESFGEEPGLVIKMESAIDGSRAAAVSWTSPTAPWPRPSTTPATATPSTAPARATTRSTRGSPSPAGATSPASTCPRTWPPSVATTSAA